MTVRFDADTHTYWNGDLRLPSVTEILHGSGAAGSLDHVPRHILEHAAARGHAVHAAVELLEDDDLDWESVTPEIVPYVRAYLGWRAQADVEVLTSEVLVHTDNYAGRYDQLLKSEEHGIVLNDLKTSSKIRDAHYIQVAAYSNAVENPVVDKGGILHLRKDETWEWVVFEIERPISIWDAFLTAFLAQHEALLKFNQWKQAKDL